MRPTRHKPTDSIPLNWSTQVRNRQRHLNSSQDPLQTLVFLPKSDILVPYNIGTRRSGQSAHQIGENLNHDEDIGCRMSRWQPRTPNCRNEREGAREVSPQARDSSWSSAAMAMIGAARPRSRHHCRTRSHNCVHRLCHLHTLLHKCRNNRQAPNPIHSARGSKRVPPSHYSTVFSSSKYCTPLVSYCAI